MFCRKKGVEWYKDIYIYIYGDRGGNTEGINMSYVTKSIFSQESANIISLEAPSNFCFSGTSFLR